MSRKPLLILFWFILAVTLFNYLVMIVWSLPMLQRMAGGLVPFDLRPGGYSFDEARALLSALGDDGIAFYENVQHLLDLTYPGLMGLSLGLAIFLLCPRVWGIWRIVPALVAVPGPIFDYLENAAVSAMLRAGPDALTPAQAAAASARTLHKAQGTTLAMLVLLALLLYGGWRWLATRRRPA